MRKKKGLQHIESGKFKGLILDMFRGYPNYRYYGMVEKVIITGENRKDLEERGILFKEDYIDSKGLAKIGYSLGANALPLVSTWKNEKFAEETRNLTKQIEFLTRWIIFFTILMVLINIITLLK